MCEQYYPDQWRKEAKEFLEKDQDSQFSQCKCTKETLDEKGCQCGWKEKVQKLLKEFGW